VLLTDNELRKVTINLLKLGGVLVNTLSLEPFVRPVVEVENIIGPGLIEATLHAADEVGKLSVLPSKIFEIDLKALAEGLPAHQEDELLDQARALTVGDSVNQRLSIACSVTLSLNLVV